MNFNWADDTNCAVTVCDTEGVVIYQNKQSISVNGSIAAKACSPCHNERSKGIIARILEKGDTNALHHREKRDPQNDLQTAWRREDGTVGGIIELSMPIPAEMPHYVRGIIEHPRTRSIRTTQRHQELQPESRKKYTKQPLSDTGEESNDRLSSKTLRRGGSKRFTTLSTAVFRKQERPRLVAGAPVYCLLPKFLESGKIRVGSNSTIV